MNPLLVILEVVHKHMTADTDEIYIETLRMIQYCITELDKHEYETDGDGELILADLKEAVADFESSLREEDDEVVDDDTDLDRENKDDLDDDEEIPGNFTQNSTEESSQPA